MVVFLVCLDSYMCKLPRLILVWSENSYRLKLQLYNELLHFVGACRYIFVKNTLPPRQ